MPRSSERLRLPRALPTLACLALVAAAVGDAHAAPMKVQIVLDMSGSMAARDKGGTRADSARTAIAKALETMPDDVPVSLRLYGHRIHKDQKEESCRDTERVVDFEEDAAEEILAALKEAKPLGQTPIEFALKESAEDLGPADETKNTVILLITDGNETCGGDPEKLVDELLKLGFEMRIYTVGLNVDRPTRKRLERIADKTGGSYTDARNTSKLQGALEKATDEIIHGPRISTKPTVPYAKNVKGAQHLISRCLPGQTLVTELVERAPNVVPEKKYGGGMKLEMEITEVEGKYGGIWTGPKEVAAKGRLTRDGKTIGTFEAKHATMGGVFKSGGTCLMVERAGELIGEDVADWLLAPRMDARLGDLD